MRVPKPPAGLCTCGPADAVDLRLSGSLRSEGLGQHGPVKPARDAQLRGLELRKPLPSNLGAVVWTPQEGVLGERG